MRCDAAAPPVPSVKNVNSLADVAAGNAQYHLGTLYEAGRGVAQSYLTAAKWYRQAARQGELPAQFELGEVYRTGRGLHANLNKAVHFMRLAAERGHAEAQYSYAEMFAAGQGLDRDDVQAYKWLTLAAKRASDKRIRDAAKRARKQVAVRLSAEQRQDAERRARIWRPQNNRLLAMPSE